MKRIMKQVSLPAQYWELIDGIESRYINSRGDAIMYLVDKVFPEWVEHTLDDDPNESPRFNIHQKCAVPTNNDVVVGKTGTEHEPSTQEPLNATITKQPEHIYIPDKSGIYCGVCLHPYHTKKKPCLCGCAAGKEEMKDRNGKYVLKREHPSEQLQAAAETNIEDILSTPSKFDLCFCGHPKNCHEPGKCIVSGCVCKTFDLDVEGTRTERAKYVAENS